MRQKGHGKGVIDENCAIRERRRWWRAWRLDTQLVWVLHIELLTCVVFLLIKNDDKRKRWNSQPHTFVNRALVHFLA